EKRVLAPTGLLRRLSMMCRRAASTSGLPVIVRLLVLTTTLLTCMSHEIEEEGDSLSRAEPRTPLFPPHVPCDPYYHSVILPYRHTARLCAMVTTATLQTRPAASPVGGKLA